MISFPAVLLKDDGDFVIFQNAASFTGPGDIRHPAEAWRYYTAEDWADRCPGWSVLPLVDVPPSAPGKRAERLPEAEWIVGTDAVEVAYRLTDLSATELAVEVEAVRSAKVRAIDAERDRRLELGALHAGKRFATSDSSRTDLGGMATTAGLVMLGALPDWPDDYAKGWIAIDNTRLPLPTPADGVALAAAVALAYSATVQHARDLKDAALIAADPATVDELAGWPD